MTWFLCLVAGREYRARYRLIMASQVAMRYQAEVEEITRATKRANRQAALDEWQRHLGMPS